MIAQICVLPSITISDHGASNDALRDDAKARVAQLVEQRIENPRVGGSSPPPGTTSLEILIVNLLILKHTFAM